MEKDSWELSYGRKENYLFYPHEEVVRFVSKYIRKQIGPQEFLKQAPFSSGEVNFLDLGCGIGRHVIYAHRMGLETYGLDLSQSAIDLAVKWATAEGVSDASSRICQGDITELPWNNQFFQVVVSHGVLDSMLFKVAKKAMAETARVVAVNGLFYCDLISGDDSKHAREFAGEELIKAGHEEGTIQSYFNFSKIRDLVGEYFEIQEVYHVKKEEVLTGGYQSRYHLLLRKH